MRKPALLKRDEVVHYTLPGILPGKEVLVLNMSMKTLVQLGVTEQDAVCLPSLLREIRVTDYEVLILRALLDAYPLYAPYAVLYAIARRGNASERALTWARNTLEEAGEAGTWDRTVRPLRDLLSRLRPRLRTFHLDVHNVLEQGYVLMDTGIWENVGRAHGA
jgi:hypothetical protein